MQNKNFWCYRINKSKIKFFLDELNEGRLRQGWGWDTKQDLRDFKMDEGAGRNRAMFNKVKKGDILLVPQIPTWGEVALVEATEDWNQGYNFSIDSKTGDYGHIFPAKLLKSFPRKNANVTGNLRSTLRNPSRFWNINHYSEDVELLLNTTQEELSKSQSFDNRLESSIGSVFTEIFNENYFADKLYNKLIEQFSREEWELALVQGLRKLFPFYLVERVGGRSEIHHGTDILITLPGIMLGYTYAIAIQVKDYSGLVSKDVITQINKVDNYYDSENIKLIDKIVIITKADKSDHNDLIEFDKSVKFIFAKELKLILAEIGKSFIGIKP